LLASSLKLPFYTVSFIFSIRLKVTTSCGNHIKHFVLGHEMNNGQYVSTLGLQDSWSVFMKNWWQTLSVTLIAAIVACCSVVWTLKMAAKISENEV
jgi:hypothetical protein